MKKVCLIDYDMSIRGGVEQVTAALSAALTDYYEVHLLSLCMNGEPAYELDPRVRFEVLLEREDRLRVMMAQLRPVMKAYFQKHAIDVAIIQGNYPGLLTAQMRFLGKTRLIFCDHGALINQWARKDIVAIRLIASLLCHRVIALTEQSRDDYIHKFYLPKKKVGCIYNWIDLHIHRSDRYAIQSRRIVSAGRFGHEKGFDMLVKAFAPVAKRHPDWHLDLFGDGEMMPVVKQLIAELGLENNVHLMGMCSDLAERYKDYAMYVLPSYREGMPLVLLEAKANRLPIVSFDIMTGPREIVRDRVDGILIPPYDLDKLGAAMCQLIENPKLRQDMANRSQENLDKFSKATILNQWRSLIDEE